MDAGMHGQEIEARQNRASIRAKACLVATTTAAAAAAITATSAAVFTTTSTAATRALFAWLGHIDREGSAVHFLAVQGLDGLLRLLGSAHGHKAKAAGAIGHAIHHQVGFGDRAMRGERVLEVVFSGVEGKVSHKQFITHVMFNCPTNFYFLPTVPDHRVSNHL